MNTFPLSPFRKADRTLYISGQIGQKNGQLVSESVSEQTFQSIENIVEILKQNELDLSHVIDVTAFITDQSDY